MDDSLQPCIVQALPATIMMDKETSVKKEKGTSARRDRETPPRDTSSTPQELPSSRRTRSQAAPDWTVHETIILVSEVAASDEDWLKALSSYQKWKIVSDNCCASDVMRSSNQCKRRWESLLADYKSIRNWESKSRAHTYWSLQSDARKKYGLPALFDHEVFDAMDAFIRPEEAPKGVNDSDSEDLVDAAKDELLDLDNDNDSEKETYSRSQENVLDPLDTLSDLGDNSSEDLIVRSDVDMVDANADTVLVHEQGLKGGGDITISGGSSGLVHEPGPKGGDITIFGGPSGLVHEQGPKGGGITISGGSSGLVPDQGPKGGDITISGGPSGLVHEQVPKGGDITISGGPSDSEKKTLAIHGKSAGNTKEMAIKLEEDAQRIHAILRGEIADNASSDNTLVDVTKPSPTEIEFARRQADELIKAFSGLAGTLDQFTKLILDGGCGGIRSTSSMT